MVISDVYLALFCVQSERSLRGAGTGQTLAAVRAELEAARQEAAQALDSLCAEREGRVQDALRLQDAVPLAQHQEALVGLSEQLAQTAAELQREAALRCQVQAEATRLQEELQGSQRDLISREEHEKLKVRWTLSSFCSTALLKWFLLIAG